MIGIFEALDWLNVIDGRISLTDEERRLSMLGRIVSLPDEDVTMILDRLQAAGRGTRNPLERAEVLLQIAAIEYWRRWFQQAARDAGEATQTYRMANNEHRRAVAAWILGMAQWELSQNNEAYTNWDEARTFFSQSQNNWYREPTRQMEIDLIARPEEIFTWLNEFQPSSLTASSRQVIEMVQENIRQWRYPDANDLLRDLQEINRWSRDPFELAEACLECALTAYQVNPLVYATRLVEKAVIDFAPGIGNIHKQVIARCLLGALDWRDDGKQRRARLGWMRCLTEFEELRLQADQNNNQNQRLWYVDRRAILEAALADQWEQANRPRR